MCVCVFHILCMISTFQKPLYIKAALINLWTPELWWWWWWGQEFSSSSQSLKLNEVCLRTAFPTILQFFQFNIIQFYFIYRTPNHSMPSPALYMLMSSPYSVTEKKEKFPLATVRRKRGRLAVRHDSLGSRRAKREKIITEPETPAGRHRQRERPEKKQHKQQERQVTRLITYNRRI